MATESCVITVRVTPRSSRNRLSGPVEALRAWVNAPPVEGAANEAVARLLADGLRIPTSRIVLVRGESSRTKTFRVEGITLACAAERLAGGGGG